MKSLIGHTASGIVGSTVASIVVDSGNVIAAALLIGLCLSFVASQLLLGARS